ncbi:hypothetical protein QNH26_14560 [Peribacillus frigoritolerans]|uniref:hypothetical protein n=1 Tax=Peribacillus frigoritolerans TaxID=450367 RepID=UPI0024C12EC4|nr:hypothetical protein [Peribacillus frigoritolerans]WHX64939.1 hypothetical protein QNH26_14560 [Peribacillus frigoritolerans]
MSDFLKIALGAISFTVDLIVEGEIFLPSNSAECTLVKITCEECHIRFQPGTLTTFINKCPSSNSFKRKL